MQGWRFSNNPLLMHLIIGKHPFLSGPPTKHITLTGHKLDSQKNPLLQYFVQNNFGWQDAWCDRNSCELQPPALYKRLPAAASGPPGATVRPTGGHPGLPTTLFWPGMNSIFCTFSLVINLLKINTSRSNTFADFFIKYLTLLIPDTGGSHSFLKGYSSGGATDVGAGCWYKRLTLPSQVITTALHPSG